MSPLFMNIVILILVIMRINLNESKPLLFDAIQAYKPDAPIDRTVSYMNS